MSSTSNWSQLLPIRDGRRSGRVPPDEVAAVLNAALRDRTVYGVRDAVIISLLFTTGIRDLDLVNIEVGDCDSERGTVEVRREKPFIMELSATGKLALHNWIRIRGSGPGKLINPILRPAQIVLKPFHLSNVGAVLKRRLREAGLPSFRSDDVTRSQSFRIRQGWRRPPVNSQVDDCHTPVSLHSSMDPFATSSSSSRLLAQLLVRFSPERRDRILAKLDQIAQGMSNGTKLAADFDWCGLHPRDLPPTETLVSRGYSLREIRGMKTALCSLMRTGVLGGTIQPDLYVAIAKRTPRTLASQRRPVKLWEIEGLIRRGLDDGSPAALRGAVIVGLLWEKALGSASAVASPPIASPELVTCIHRDPNSKGGCFLPVWRQALARWVSVCPPGMGYLLLKLDDRGTILPQPMSEPALCQALERLSQQAGINRTLGEDIRRGSLQYVISRTTQRENTI